MSDFKTRIIHKHDVEENWLKATAFVPKKGEIIIYDADDTCTYTRLKIGDGETIVSNLPFILSNEIAEAKLYTDNAVAQKTQVQIVTWEADD